MNKRNWNSLIAVWLIAFSLTAVSCVAHIHGDGNVVKEDRNLSNFEAISVSTGIEVLVNQDSFEKVVVEADENILKILKTEVTGGKLKIYLEESVWHAKKMKVYVTLKQLKVLEASAGSEVNSGNKINAENLRIHASSGADVSVEVSCNNLTTDSSSGSNLKISGTTQYFTANSSSGAGLHATDLVSENGNLGASSGAHISAKVTKELKAHASSGASINVSGNPSSKDTNSSSGGSVHIQ